MHTQYSSKLMWRRFEIRSTVLLYEELQLDLRWLEILVFCENNIFNPGASRCKHPSALWNELPHVKKF